MKFRLSLFKGIFLTLLFSTLLIPSLSQASILRHGDARLVVGDVNFRFEKGADGSWLEGEVTELRTAEADYEVVLQVPTADFAEGGILDLNRYSDEGVLQACAVNPDTILQEVDSRPFNFRDAGLEVSIRVMENTSDHFTLRLFFTIEYNPSNPAPLPGYLRLNFFSEGRGLETCAPYPEDGVPPPPLHYPGAYANSNAHSTTTSPFDSRSSNARSGGRRNR